MLDETSRFVLGSRKPISLGLGRPVGFQGWYLFLTASSAQRIPAVSSRWAWTPPASNDTPPERRGSDVTLVGMSVARNEKIPSTVVSVCRQLPETGASMFSSWPCTYAEPLPAFWTLKLVPQIYIVIYSEGCCCISNYGNILFSSICTCQINSWK